nr:hypothetical protein [Tanacetum cinerariifolium]
TIISDSKDSTVTYTTVSSPYKGRSGDVSPGVDGPPVGEISAAAAARPIEGRRADYGFVGSVEAEIRRRIAEDIGYGIRDTWIDPRDVSKEEALTTLEGVNTRVTELAAVQEQDTQDQEILEPRLWLDIVRVLPSVASKRYWNRDYG